MTAPLTAFLFLPRTLLFQFFGIKRNNFAFLRQVLQSTPHLFKPQCLQIAIIQDPSTPQRWRKAHPGYWGKRPHALQDSLIMQPSVLIGLIAKLTGSALQDDIAYYGDRSICRRLAMDETALQKARQELVRLDLIAWQRPLYQVLAIDSVSKPRPRGNLQSLAQVLQQFFTDFVPAAIDAWLHKDSAVTYAPYLMGSRYSLVPLKAGFSGLTKETTREELIAAVVRGLCEYQREHLEEISLKVHFKGEIRVSGEAVNSSLIRAKRKWMRNCDYTLEKDSSLRGAAMLGQKFFAK